PVTILNTLDHLGKFDGKADKGFLVGYSINSKAFRVFISRTRKVEKNLHVNFLENKPNVAGSGPELLFDIDTLTNSMNYHPVSAGNRTNGNTDDAGKKNEVKDSVKEGNMNGTREATNTDNTNRLNTVSLLVNTVSSFFTTMDPGRAKEQRNDAYDDEYVGAEADLGNLEINMSVSPIPITKIHKDHPKAQIIGEVDSAVQSVECTKQYKAGLITFINKQRRTNHKDFQNCRSYAGRALQFQTNECMDMVVLLMKKSISIDYDEVFAPVARIEAIRLFLAFASFMGFTVYQMDVKSAFLYGTIEEEVYVNQPPGFVDPEFPNRVYKVEKALYGLHQAPRAWYETLSTYLLENRFRRGTIDKTLFIKKTRMTFYLVEQEKDGNILSQDKYVYEILKKFGFSSVKTASTLMETHKPLSQDTAGTDVDVHLYRSMIRSLMYLTSSRPDIMFVVCACSRFQVQPKASHMHAVKRIFRYLKGQPTLGLWYPKDSPMDLIAYSDSDYAGASIDRKSTTGGCQFLGCRLISWQCKKQTIVANSTTKAEYIAASNCRRQIHVDNESAICVVKNPVYHSKTKHIDIRHHFIRDSYEKKLIEMVKIHTDYNVAYLLTKAFDVTRISKIDCLLSSEVLFEQRLMMSIMDSSMVGDEAVHKDLGDRMKRAATTASSLKAEQDSGNIN
ncbi:putative ribonuclease H-like domain-containing protein, partial [Tanacetum coccineum]